MLIREDEMPPQKCVGRCHLRVTSMRESPAYRAGLSLMCGRLFDCRFFSEGVAGNHGGGDRCRESAVERDVGDEGRDFVASETVVDSPKQMGRQLLRSVHDDQHSEGGDAAVAWAKSLSC